MAFYRGVYFLGNDSDLLLMIEVVSVVVKIFSGGGGEGDKRLNIITEIQLKHYCNVVNRFILVYIKFKHRSSAAYLIYKKSQQQ